MGQNVNLNAAMGHEDDYEDDWMAEAPTLAAHDKKVDPEVPEGYFEELPSQVLARIRAIAQEEAPSEPVLAPTLPLPAGRIFGFRRSFVWSAAAGIVLLIAVGSYYLTRSSQDTPATYATLDEEVAAQLATVGVTALVQGLDGAAINDEELFAMLGDDASGAFDDHDHAVPRDEAYEYLQDVNLDAIDLQGLDIDLRDLD